jgi:hypothetical protein
MFTGRDYGTKKPHRECYSYLISSNQWLRYDELRLSQSIIPYEARGFIQLNYNVTDDFSLSWVMGGQDIYNRIVTHEILGVKLFRDPSKNKNKILSFYDIYSLDLLPQHLSGSCVTMIPSHDQSQHHRNENLLVLGGSLSEGPFCSSSIYEWTPPSNKVLANLPADISTKPNCSQLESYTIESARFGLHDVTHEIETLLASGTIAYPDYLFKPEDCYHFQLMPQSPKHKCDNELSVTIFDKRLNRRYTSTCTYPYTCRLIYC